MVYRTNAKKDDMIIELNQWEIKQACIEYISHECQICVEGITPDHASIEIKKNSYGDETPIVRIECSP